MEKNIIKIEEEIKPFKDCKLTLVGLDIKKGLPFKDWEKIGESLRKINGVVQWALGDWLNYGEQKYGEMYSQALEKTDYDYETLKQYKRVADKVKKCSRLHNLSWSHHQVVAHLEEKEQVKLLKKAEEENWTRAELRQAIKESKQKDIPLPKGKFQVIYMDIPWKYDVDLSKGSTRSPENNYPVMDLEEIKRFGPKVKELAADDCVLFMWITAPMLNWMNDVLDACGFEYKTNLIWDKVKHNLGHYSSVRHEILIIAGRGRCTPNCDGKTIQSIDSVQSIEKTSRHSEKPKEFYEIIEKLYPNKKYLELFARNNEKRQNWTYWGEEANA